jgi:hypothetical protein
MVHVELHHVIKNLHRPSSIGMDEWMSVTVRFPLNTLLKNDEGKSDCAFQFAGPAGTDVFRVDGSILSRRRFMCRRVLQVQEWKKIVPQGQKAKFAGTMYEKESNLVPTHTQDRYTHTLKDRCTYTLKEGR